MKTKYDHKSALKLLPIAPTTLVSELLGIPLSTLSRFKVRMEAQKKLTVTNVRLDREQCLHILEHDKVLFTLSKPFKRRHKEPVTFVDRQFIEDYIGEWPLPKIAAWLGRSLASLYLILSEMGISTRNASGLLTFTDLTDLLKLSRRTIERAIKDGKLEKAHNEQHLKRGIRCKVKNQRYKMKEMHTKGKRVKVRKLSQLYARRLHVQNEFTYSAVNTYLKNHRPTHEMTCLYCNASIKGHLTCSACSSLLPD